MSWCQMNRWMCSSVWAHVLGTMQFHCCVVGVLPCDCHFICSFPKSFSGQKTMLLLFRILFYQMWVAQSMWSTIFFLGGGFRFSSHNLNSGVRFAVQADSNHWTVSELAKIWKQKPVPYGFSFYIVSAFQLENAVALHQAHDDGRGLDTLRFQHGWYLNDF